MQFDDEDDVGNDGQAEQENEKFGRLALEDVFLFLGEGDNADQLPLQSDEVGLEDTNGQPILLTKGFELSDLLLRIDLDQQSAFVDQTIFVCSPLSHIFLYHGH